MGWGYSGLLWLVHRRWLLSWPCKSVTNDEDMRHGCCTKDDLIVTHDVLALHHLESFIGWYLVAWLVMARF
jgi:hypothetical protein